MHGGNNGEKFAVNELERLNVSFYDPYMIIQKTQGRMAEDDFWIRMDDDRNSKF